MEGSPHSAVQPVLQVKHSPVLHHMREKITEKGRILGQEGFKIEGAFGGHQFIEADRTRRKSGPGFGRVVTMVGVRASLAHSFEYHTASLWKKQLQRNE
jgi:hypothetical protein